jgi:hypothetical protein
MRGLLLVLLGFGALGADAPRVVLMQELVRLEAMERKTLLVFPLEQQGAQLEVKFESKRGGEGVRVAVFERTGNVALAGSTYELNGILRVPLAREREYRLEIENLRQRLGHALVDVDVSLIFGKTVATPEPGAARGLEAGRRLYTIWASLGLFGLMAGYAAIRLTPPVLRRLRGEI